MRARARRLSPAQALQGIDAQMKRMLTPEGDVPILMHTAVLGDWCFATLDIGSGTLITLAQRETGGDISVQALRGPSGRRFVLSWGGRMPSLERAIVDAWCAGGGLPYLAAVAVDEHGGLSFTQWKQRNVEKHKR